MVGLVGLFHLLQQPTFASICLKDEAHDKKEQDAYRYRRKDGDEVFHVPMISRYASAPPG